MKGICRPRLVPACEVSAEGRARRRRMKPMTPLEVLALALGLAVTEADARRVARRMARWRSAGSGQPMSAWRAAARTGTWQSLHNVEDPGTVGTTRGPATATRGPDRMNAHRLGPLGRPRVSILMKEDSRGAAW